jgi:protein-tyrosine-phosphatase
MLAAGSAMAGVLLADERRRDNVLAAPLQRGADRTVTVADVVVTMDCGDACPYVSGKRCSDWDLPDISGRPVDEVRVIRDDLERRVVELVQELSW